MEFRTFPNESEENAEKRRRHFDKSKKLQAKAEKLLAESADEAALYEKLTEQAQAEQLKKSTGAKTSNDDDVSMADDESNVSHAGEMIATLQKPEQKDKKDKTKEKKDKSKKSKTSTLPEMATILAEAIDEALPTISPEQQLLSEAESAIEEKRKKKSKKEKKGKSSKTDVNISKSPEDESASLPQEPEAKKKKRKREAATAEPEAQPDKKVKKDKKEKSKSKSKKTTEEPQAPADAEKWNVDELEGGAARQSKFLRLLGAKKQGIDTDKAVGGHKNSKSNATQAEADIQRQYELGMMKKNDGGGHRRGLGA